MDDYLIQNDYISFLNDVDVACSDYTGTDRTKCVNLVDLAISQDIPATTLILKNPVNIKYQGAYIQKNQTLIILPDSVKNIQQVDCFDFAKFNLGEKKIFIELFPGPMQNCNLDI